MASARYWRLYFPFGGQAGTEIGVSEVELRTTAGGSDVATGGTASASSSFDAPYLPANAFDNSNASEWVTSTGATVGAWLKYDFGAANDKDIAEVTIRSRNSFADRAPAWVVIQRSSDDANWVTEWSSATSGWAASTTYTFTKPTTGNGSSNPAYWRIRFPAGPESDAVYTSIAGLELRATASGANTITTSGADGGYPYAKTRIESASAGANQFVDTSASNRWQSDGGALTDEWIAYKYVDINTYDIQEIVITASNLAGEPDQTPSYGLIESSTDGSTWTRKWYYHKSGTWGSGASTTFTKQTDFVLTSTTGHRYWRIKIDSSPSPTVNATSMAAVAFRTGAGLSDLSPMADVTASVSASGSYPAYAVDGQAGTAWTTTVANSFPKYLTFDFTAANNPAFNRVAITAHATQGGNQAPTAGSIQWSNDGTNWFSAYDFTGLTWTNGETKEFTFSSVPTYSGIGLPPAYPIPPPDLFNDRHHRIQIARSVTLAMAGKTNNVIQSLTLNASTTTTILAHSLMTYYSGAVLIPMTASASTAVTWISSITEGTMTVTHDSSAATDRTFRVVVIG